MTMLAITEERIAQAAKLAQARLDDARRAGEIGKQASLAWQVGVAVRDTFKAPVSTKDAAVQRQIQSAKDSIWAYYRNNPTPKANLAKPIPRTWHQDYGLAG